MESWLEVEDKFRQLKGLENLWLDIQWGSSGEHWSIVSRRDTPEVARFKILVDTAGSALKVALPKEFELMEEGCPEIRWYRAVKFFSGESLNTRIAFETDRITGEQIGCVYSGRIDNIASVSANLCLWLHENHPIKDTQTRWEKFYESHGREIIVGIIVALVTAVILASIGL